MRHRLILGLCLALVTTASIAGAADDTPPYTVAGDDNPLALKLYHRLATKPGNLLFSPCSLRLDLAMAYTGARGRTASQMATALDFPTSPKDVADSYAEFAQELSYTAGVVLSVSSALWVQQGVTLDPVFVNQLDKKFGAHVSPVDFAASPESARQAINQWAESKTKGRVHDLLGPDSVGPNTSLVLTDAAYFAGKWKNEFKPADTRMAAFHLDGQRDVSVPMMHGQFDGIYINQSAGLQVIELPYNGDNFVMDLLVPTTIDGLPAIEKQLDGPHLKQWTALEDGHTVKVSMPRMKIAGGISGKVVLATLGLTDAVDPEHADFNGMISAHSTHHPPLYMGQLAQQAAATVDEEGTEVTVATDMGLSMSALARPTPVIKVTVDRPFIFFIRHRHMGSILFMGRVCDPR